MFRLLNPTSKDFSLRSCVIAVAIVSVGVAARATMDPVLPLLSPFITLYPAIAIAGLLCGPFAGAVAGLLGVVAAFYLWIPPRMSFGMPSATDCVATALFVATSAIVLWVEALLRAQLNAVTVARHVHDLGLAAGGVGTWEYDLRTQRITASNVAHALHGLPASGRTVAEDWLRGVHPDDVAAAQAALRTAVADGTLASYSYRIVGGADGPKWIAARGRVVSTGGERRLLCALVDITDQIRVQEELRRERRRLRLALEAGSFAVWDYDPVTDVATIDARYAATLGFDPGVTTMTRKQLGKYLHPEDRPRVAAEHEALIASGANYNIEYRITTASGDTRWLLSQGIRIDGDVTSDPGRMVGVIQDITARKRREQELRDLAAARELLVREADHRIKNSLQLVISLLSVQLRNIDDAAAADALREAITRVGAIAASHLALQGSADLREVDFAITLNELSEHFTQLHPGVAIVCRAAPGLQLDADRAIPLGLAVSEVLTNALRHAFPDRHAGSVSVDAAIERGQLVVRVGDDGVGMLPKAGRAGLGSTILRSLANQVEASIHIDSTPRVGTIVTLRLPLHQAATERATA